MNKVEMRIWDNDANEYKTLCSVSISNDDLDKMYIDLEVGELISFEGIAGLYKIYRLFNRERDRIWLEEAGPVRNYTPSEE